MTSIPLRRALGAGFAVVLAVAAAGCGDDDDTTATTTTQPAETTTTASPSTTGSATASTQPSTTAPEPANLVEVTIAGGEVAGGVQRASVPLGEEVTIRVLSDADDEVHVHGYDIEQAVTAGQPADITFVADLGGVWEVELHELEIPIVELEVS